MKQFIKKLLQTYLHSLKVTTALIVFIFFIVNWLSYSLYIRFDISRTGRFRLAAATKLVLKQLPDQVTLEAFFSGKVPDAYLQQVKLSRDFLQEYASASGGKIKIVFIDPDSSDTGKERAQTLNIPQSQISVQGDNALEVKRIYLAVALSFGDDVQVIQNIVNTRFLEYELTSKIYRMAYPGERGIGVLVGHGKISTGSENPIESLKFADSTFSSFYGNMQSVDTSEEEIPSSVTTMLIVGATHLSDMDKYRIDQFIMRGGNIIFSLSGMIPDLERGTVLPISSKIIDFLKHYGFTLGSDMLFEPVNFLPIRRPYPGNSFFTQEIPYPIWIFSNKTTLNQEYVMTKGVPGLFFPWTSSLKLNDKVFLEDSKEENKKVKDKKKYKGKMIVLAKTSDSAWSHSDGTLYLAPQVVAGLLKDSSQQKNKGSFNLAGYAEGWFASYFSGDNKIPAGASRNYLKESEKIAKIMVIPTSYFMTNQFVQLAEQANFSNLSFVLSALDVMNGLEELVESRNKNVSDPALPVMEIALKRVWTIVNFILPLIGILIFGLFRFYNRRKISKKVYLA